MPLILALLAQAGAMVTPGAAPPLPHEKGVEVLRPPRHSQSQPAQAAVQSGDARSCISQAGNRPAQAEEFAKAWLAKAQGAQKAMAGECLGIALTHEAKWDEAQAAFSTARDAATDKAMRARLGAMAGNAALARGDATGALAALDSARADASADKAMLSGIAADRARALVALKRDGEAAIALDEARNADPGNAQAWLLSATLSRRMNKLAEAQTQIEKAASLLPADPGIGLEAGVIAVLSGHDEAARKSWQSVITAAPDSDEAATAKGYLAQLGPAPAQAARP
jgi:tetratricopeptide (TPR) repeat protein